MTTYVIRNGKLIEKYLADPIIDQPSFHVISDTMDHTWHPASGKYFDSKSEFRKETKAYGCIEVGDQKNYGKQRTHVEKLDKGQRREAIQKAVYDLRNGRH